MRKIPRGIIIIELASSFFVRVADQTSVQAVSIPLSKIGAVPRVTGRFEVRSVEKKPVGATPAEANIRADEDRAQKL